MSAAPRYVKMVFMNKSKVLGLALVASTALAGCGGATAGEESPGASTAASASANAGTLNVVAAFYPLQYAAESVGGDAVSVTGLTPPGVEPHDLELTPEQVAKIKDADLVVYVPGFQPAVDAAVEQYAKDKAVDARAGITLLAADHSEEESPADPDHAGEESTTDPHVWLNPANMATIGSAIAKGLESRAPQQASGIAARTTEFASAMDALAGQYRTALATCRIKDMVVSHEAFGYLAQAFGLTQVGISGLSPDAEPSPARLAELAGLVKSSGVTTIYYETLVDPKVAETLASETGTTTAVLDPIEGLSPGSGDTYETIMESNLATLTKGQACA